MALLEGMPKEVMEGDANRMYYGLLKIKAANNLYMVQKDSTIFHIVDYFEDSGDKEKLRDSYYFLGKYYVEHNDAPQALKCFQTALDMSDEKTPLAFRLPRQSSIQLLPPQTLRSVSLSIRTV